MPLDAGRDRWVLPAGWVLPTGWAPPAGWVPPVEREFFIARSCCGVGWWLFSGLVVRVLRLVVLGAGHDLAVGGAVGAGLVGGGHSRRRTRPSLHRPVEVTPGRGLVPSVLGRDVQGVAVLVGGPSRVWQPPVGLDEGLVEVPLVTGPGVPVARRACVGLPERGVPAADRLMGGDGRAAFGHEVLGLAGAEREAVVRPHTVGDGLDRVRVLLVRRRRASRGRPFRGWSARRSSRRSADVAVPGRPGRRGRSGGLLLGARLRRATRCARVRRSAGPPVGVAPSSRRSGR